MTELVTRSVPYTHEGTEHIGHFVAGADGRRPGVLLIHDAFGVSEPMKEMAARIAELGYAVLLADLWGGGRSPGSHEEIGPLIGELAGNRELWIGRIRASHEQLLAQEEVAEAPVTAVGYCFGGASVLEYVRVGGEVGGAVSFHGGLDLVDEDWSKANRASSVLILTGADDPMAPEAAVRVLEQSMTAAGLDWELTSYGGAKHGFTNPHADRAGRPEAIAYSARADRHSWDAFTRFAKEIAEGVAGGSAEGSAERAGSNA